MKAIRCDRCGTYQRYGKSLSGQVARTAIGGLLHWYPDQFDLCDDCSSEVKEMLKTWWKPKDDAHGQANDDPPGYSEKPISNTKDVYQVGQLLNPQPDDKEVDDLNRALALANAASINDSHDTFGVWRKDSGEILYIAYWGQIFKPF